MNSLPPSTDTMIDRLAMQSAPKGGPNVYRQVSDLETTPNDVRTVVQNLLEQQIGEVREECDLGQFEIEASLGPTAGETHLASGMWF